MASSVLRHVTNRKLAKLHDAQTQFEAVLSAVKASKSTDINSLQYSQRLLDTIKKLRIADEKDSVLANMALFLRQAQHDSSIPDHTMTQWQEQMERMLHVHSTRFVYASLFGNLVNEWLRNPNFTSKQSAGPDEKQPAAPGREEMHQQRKIWESIALSKPHVDTSALNRYLTSLFGTANDTQEVTTLDAVRKGLGFKALKIKPLDTKTMKDVIFGVLKSDLFAGAKRASLLELQDNPAVLEEMVDVLNMDLKGLKDWRWENDAVSIELRRQVNGKYRFFLDEEIHQGLLLHYVGASVAVRLRRMLETFMARAWVEQSDSSMTEDAIKRRAYFLQQITDNSRRTDSIALEKPMKSVREMRHHEYRCNYFLIQMPKSISGGVGDYSGEENDDDRDSYSNPMDTKQSILEAITTDMHLQLPTKGRFSVVQTDFKWFGPSLPHATILTVLQFFGFSDDFLAFFKAFLEVPITFAQDGPDAKPVKRSTGVPMSHCLSDAMSETVLFCLDFAVNKATNGGNLIRFHDDLWFWGDVEQCKTAWNTIETFCTVTGLELNPDKTGSIVMTADKTVHNDIDGLPSGPVTWGFLKLDAAHHRWAVDRSQVDVHIAELGLQLSACRSVFATVQAWNAYVSRFFLDNFGRATNCHGPAHQADLLDAFQFLQRKLFPSGSVTAHISALIQDRFSVTVPAGFLYLPTELGGLGLANPFIALLAQQNPVAAADPEPVAPADLVAACLARERHDYEQARARWERERPAFRSLNGWKPAGGAEDEFFLFDEYAAPREELSKHFAEARATLRLHPDKARVFLSPELEAGIKAEEKSLPAGWAAKEGNKWLVALYGPEVLQRFGRLCVADRELLPVGLVNALRGEKVRWLG